MFIRKIFFTVACFMPFFSAFAEEVAGEYENADDARPTLAIQKIAMGKALLAGVDKDGSRQTIQRILETLETNVNTAFVSAGTFQMVSRDNLDALMKEQSLADSGNANNSDTSAAAGMLAKGKYILALTITDFQDFIEKQNFATIEHRIEYRDIRLSAVGSIINSSTGKIIAAPTFTISKHKRTDDETFKSQNGSLSDKLINMLSREMATKIAVKAADILVPAMVIDKTGKTVGISRGSDAKVKKGDIYEICVVKKKTDKRTKRVFSAEIPVGKIKITRLAPDTSYGKILEDDGIDAESEVPQIARYVDPEEDEVDEDSADGEEKAKAKSDSDDDDDDTPAIGKKKKKSAVNSSSE